MKKAEKSDKIKSFRRGSKENAFIYLLLQCTGCAKKQLDPSSHFNRTPACDRQTDGQTAWHSLYRDEVDRAPVYYLGYTHWEIPRGI